MNLIDTDILPEDKVFNPLDEEQTIDNEESEDPEEYDYSCYR